MAKGGSSHVKRFRRCKHAYWYSDILDLERKTQSVIPYRGTVLHDCLQNHYTDKDWTEPIKKIKIDYDNIFDEERELWGELVPELYRIMKGYINAYRERDKGIKTLATEIKFEMPLAGGKHTYTGIIDWIYEDAEGVWIADHKTVKVLPSEQDLYLELQPLMYFLACKRVPELQEIIKDKKLAGVLFNHIRTKAPKVPKILKNGTLSKASIDTDIYTYFDEVKKHGFKVEDYKVMLDKLKNNVFYRRTRIPVKDATLRILENDIIATMNEIDRYKAAYEKYGERARKLFTRNTLARRCEWDCQYRGLCFGELAGMDIQGILQEEYKEREKRYDGQ